MLQNISWSSFNVKVFASITSSGNLLSFCFMLNELPWLSPCDHIGGVNIPMSAISTVNPIYAGFTFHFQFYYYLFLCCTFIFVLANTVFVFCIFVKCQEGLFITGRQGGNTTSHFAVCMWTHRYTVTNHWQALTEWYDWSWIMLHICYFSSDLWMQDLVVKFLYNYSWLYTIVTDIWNLLLVEWC